MNWVWVKPMYYDRIKLDYVHCKSEAFINLAKVKQITKDDSGLCTIWFHGEAADDTILINSTCMNLIVELARQ